MGDSSSCFCSIIVATHNQAEFLPQCLDSVLSQGMARAECQIIVVDDGSSDDTANIISGYGSNIDAVVTHAQRKGLVAACNSGLQRAQGRFIVRVDSDDWLHAAALEELRSAAESDPSADIIIPCYWIVGGNQVEVIRPDMGNIFTWMAGGPLLRRQAVMDAGGYRKFYWEEYDLYLRMLCQGAKVKGLASPVLYHREHPSSMTARKEDRAGGWRELAEAWPMTTLRKYGCHEELTEIWQSGVVH